MQQTHAFNSWIQDRAVALLPTQRDVARLYRGDAHGETLAEVNFEAPFSVRETLRASSALALMRDAGVRAALVTDGMDDGEFRRICGLASARGMQRELLARWEPELAVAEVMTLWEDVSVVHWDSVCSLTTRQLHEMFRGTGLSHVVVVDHAEEWQVHVKALLSRTALAQRLGH